MKRGFAVLRDKALNRSIAFGRDDRDRLGLRGLLPHRVATDRQMVQRVMANLERLPRDIDRYMLLSSLQERRSDPAAHLHAHGRRGVPGVLAHRPGPEGLLHHP